MLSQRLFKSAYIVSFMTFISRVFGLLRDIVIANIFGANAGSDTFFIAFKIPNYLRRLFAEGSFLQAFVPVLAEYKEKKDEASVKDFLDHVCGRLSLVLFGITLLGSVAAPLWIMIFAPGFIGDDDKIQLSVHMLRITFPYIFFISLTAFAGGILNVYGRFAAPAFTPVLLNISLILSAVFLSPYFQQPVVALAWGIFIAGIMQLMFQIPFLIRIGRLPVPRFNRGHAGVGRVLRLMLPTLFSVSIAQINLIVDMLMASFLVAGSISWLYYSDRLMEFPLGVFGVALATVILPILSEKYAQGAAASFSKIMDWALRWIVLISIPAAMGLMLLAEPILITIFQRGEFTAWHAMMSAKSLIAYAFGLTALILVKIFASGCLSRQDAKTPVKIGIIAMFSNIFMNLILIGPLAHAGLALATSIASFINAGLLFYHLKKNNIYLPASGWSVFAARVFCAVSFMSAVLYFAAPDVPLWGTWDTLTRVLQLTLWIIIGACSYFAILWLSGLRPATMALYIE